MAAPLPETLLERGRAAQDVLRQLQDIGRDDPAHKDARLWSLACYRASPRAMWSGASVAERGHYLPPIDASICFCAFSRLNEPGNWLCG
jgi:hypothetical protein